MPPIVPPRYDQTIRLSLGPQAAWLEITNYEDVLLANGDSDKVITLQVGLLTYKGKGIQKLAQPNDASDLFSISNWLDVPDIIKFQQSVLEYWKQTSLPAWDYTASYGYLIPALVKAFGAIGCTIPASLPSTWQDLLDAIHNSLQNYSKTHYLRSNWTTVPVPGSAPRWQYNGEVPGLLNPNCYTAYEELGFIPYFPKLGLILQEQRCGIANDVTGGTLFWDARKIRPVESKLINKLPAKWQPTGKDAFQPVIDKIDAGIKNASQLSGQSGAPTGGKLYSELSRMNCYGFRGENRGPELIAEKGGFFSNVTRKDATYATDKQKELDAVFHKDQAWNQESYIGKLVELKILHLGEYVKHANFGGFISTTRSVAVAKGFSGGWMQSADISIKQNPQDIKVNPLRYSTQNFLYAMKCVCGFVLPSDKGTSTELQAIHQFASMAEQEVAVPGMIGWNEVVGFRLCCFQPTGPFLAGPVWILSGASKLDPTGVSKLYELMSGKGQGRGNGIEKVYTSSPWGTNAILPTVTDIN
jgi:hypothetical protein